MTCGFTARDASIVATDAVSGEIGVIRRCRTGKPTAGHMADITLFDGDHMTRSLASGQDTVMTLGTSPVYLSMVGSTGR